MTREQTEALIAEVRALGDEMLWRAACDEIMDRLRAAPFDNGEVIVRQLDFMRRNHLAMLISPSGWLTIERRDKDAVITIKGVF